MPHLQFELSAEQSTADRRAFTEWITDRYADVMETGTGHVAVTIRERPDGALSLGRAAPDDPVAVLDADIRGGRTDDQRATFASAVIDRVESRFGVPADNCYVVYTEHPGGDFHLAEGPLETWSDAEAEEGAVGE